MTELSLPRLSATLALAALLGACASSKRDFDPPLTAENEVLRVEVQRAQHRKEDLRIWLSLTNKTNDTLVLAKGNYNAIVGGNTYKGYSGHGIKIFKGWELPPNYSKKIKLAYVGVPSGGGEAELRFDPVEVQGTDKTYSVSVRVPYGSDAADDGPADDGKPIDDVDDPDR